MIATKVLIDTGPLVAILYGRDSQHQHCIEIARDLPEVLFTCWPVITEAAYLLRASRAGLSMLLKEIERNRLEVMPLAAADVDSIASILKKYHDQGFDFADACILPNGNISNTFSPWIDDTFRSSEQATAPR